MLRSGAYVRHSRYVGNFCDCEGIPGKLDSAVILVVNVWRGIRKSDCDSALDACEDFPWTHRSVSHKSGMSRRQ